MPVFEAVILPRRHKYQATALASHHRRAKMILLYYYYFYFSGGWVKIKLKPPHLHVSDTCRVSRIRSCLVGSSFQMVWDEWKHLPLSVLSLLPLRPFFFHTFARDICQTLYWKGAVYPILHLFCGVRSILKLFSRLRVRELRPRLTLFLQMEFNLPIQ